MPLLVEERNGLPMAVVVWRLIGLNFTARPNTPYWIERDGRVCDVDALGWKLGVRPDMDHAVARWHYPQGTAIPWDSHRFTEIEANLRTWLRQRMERFEQASPWGGWWEWPALRFKQFEQQMAEIIPNWALQINAGVASNLLLAKAALALGEAWSLSLWSGPGFQAWILPPSQEAQWYPQIPLSLVEGISKEAIRQCNLRGWKTIGQVPISFRQKFLLKLKSEDTASQRSPETIYVQYHWELAAEGGFVEVLTRLATKITEELQRRAVGFQRLEVTWRGPWTPVRHQREWPMATGEPGKVLLRVLDFLKSPPPGPPEAIEILASGLVAWGSEQLQWGFFRLSGGDKVGKQRSDVRMGINRREAMLQFWDPWRFSPSAGLNGKKGFK